MSDLSQWEYEILHFHDPDARALRRCTPIVWDTPVPGVHGDPKWRRGAWFPSGQADVGIICWDKWCGLSRVEERVYAGRVRIDLQDATGRAHLAWWLQLEHGSGGGSIEDGGFRIDWRPGRWAWARPGVANTGREWFLCPPLQFGAKDDGRSMPDGSSLLRAIALGIIARHVAGLPIPPRPTS